MHDEFQPCGLQALHQDQAHCTGRGEDSTVSALACNTEEKHVNGTELAEHATNSHNFGFEALHQNQAHCTGRGEDFKFLALACSTEYEVMLAMR